MTRARHVHVATMASAHISAYVLCVHAGFAASCQRERYSLRVERECARVRTAAERRAIASLETHATPLVGSHPAAAELTATVRSAHVSCSAAAAEADRSTSCASPQPSRVLSPAALGTCCGLRPVACVACTATLCCSLSVCLSVCRLLRSLVAVSRRQPSATATATATFSLAAYEYPVTV